MHIDVVLVALVVACHLTFSHHELECVTFRIIVIISPSELVAQGIHELS